MLTSNADFVKKSRGAPALRLGVNREIGAADRRTSLNLDSYGGDPALEADDLVSCEDLPPKQRGSMSSIHVSPSRIALEKHTDPVTGIPPQLFNFFIFSGETRGTVKRSLIGQDLAMI